ncbi:hypothetical protein Q8A67_015686 [Cirrhinus molitorella]|uniref:IRG-type G domain-containing protein n=1 Tax=Cirrhinus molitorella TaxID=172907 RepID=A0AA88PM82_9TELE|nr:hypothetical protein Q8A67_015686 [Cirrhinus molitorella]
MVVGAFLLCGLLRRTCINFTPVKELRRFSSWSVNSSCVSKKEERCLHLKIIDLVELNIGVTGESGSGKSTFVNAFRGLGDEEEGSATTGPVETTIEPEVYLHPKYKNVKVWDLPGIGTPNFKADEYLERVEFKRYDFFIIIASDRFRECHTQLAKEIMRMGKKFYFVRSKIDFCILAEKRKKSFDEKKTLDIIRKDSENGLRKIGINDPVVFLISGWELGKYDLNVLQERMEKELPQHKRRVLMLALPNITLEINEKKKKALEENIGKVAFLSACVAAIPIPGLSITADIAIIADELRNYYKTFGLDDPSLQRLCERSGKTVEELKSLMKSPLHQGINPSSILTLLGAASILISEDAIELLGYTIADFATSHWNLLRHICISTPKETTELQSCNPEGQRCLHLKIIDLVELNIGVTGESGSGKSTFVNAFRGLGDEEELSAKTGVVETTTEPEVYHHPTYKNVKLWDLPGIGTPDFKADEYLERVEFKRYDFFIIIASDRFRECHTQLAKEIMRMRKTFYFVRSKIDSSIEAEKRKKNFDLKKTLDTIREDCENGLRKIGIDHPVVFLISGWELEKYDLNVLQERMEKELPQHKRRVLMLALPNITLEINERKKKALEENIGKVAFLSACVAAVPIPGLSIAVDLAIIAAEIEKYCNTFGLDKQSLEKLCERFGKRIETVEGLIKSAWYRGICTGTVAAGAMSYWAVSTMLKSALNDIAEDARNVLIGLLETEV